MATARESSEDAAGSKRPPIAGALRIAKIPFDESVPLSEEKVLLPSRDNGNADGALGQRGDIIPSYLQTCATAAGIEGSVIDTIPLIRMTHPTSGSSDSPESLAGLFAYTISSTLQSAPSLPNIRATRLAMACGLHSQRFVGDVFVGRLGYLPQPNGGYALSNLDLSLADIESAARYSPDLRSVIVNVLQEEEEASLCIPEWLGNASQKNYHDGASLAALADAMTNANVEDSDEEGSSASDNSSEPSSLAKKDKETEKPLTETTLCLHCRGPASTLCEGCGGAYFCEEPRKCKLSGWSHQCYCSTWSIYVQRRKELSSFPYFSGWQLPLLGKDCYSSETVYQRFLSDNLGVIGPTQQNWWATELHGWSGGASLSSKDVNVLRRVSYQDGFALKRKEWIPEERPVTREDIERANASYAKEVDADTAQLIQTDEHELPILASWEHYYRLRTIPPSSPVGLLLTFPLTMYYAIQRFGSVPLEVAQMLERPLRIHLVGVEKELNFVDLFKELAFLLPEKVCVDMTWVVREDMFPESSDKRSLSLHLAANLKLSIVGGTYGQSLNPDFDMGGPPDMIVGMNAGLFAYESWRHVVSYLHHHKNTIGVFTDYNEHSGMNCASLGGRESTCSLTTNPFRQMRAMPVYCMNLPQFCNGFIYTFNKQELD
ncbi:hypothetical protein ACHAXT_001049 [Thalassiosira profunda]